MRRAWPTNPGRKKARHAFEYLVRSYRSWDAATQRYRWADAGHQQAAWEIKAAWGFTGRMTHSVRTIANTRYGREVKHLPCRLISSDGTWATVEFADGTRRPFEAHLVREKTSE